MANNIRFQFCGEPVVPSENARTPFVKRDSVMFSSGETDKISINFGIKNLGNCPYVTAQGFKHGTVRTRDKNNTAIEVAWENRLDEDVISQVSSLNKFVVNLTERKVFITEWDMIEYLENVLPDFKDDIAVRGRFIRRPGSGASKDRYFDEFRLDTVIAASKLEKYKRGMRFVADLYYNKDCLDTSAAKSEGKIYLRSYTPMWISSERKEMMVPLDVVFDLAQHDIDLSTDIGKKRMKYFLDKQLGNKFDKYKKVRWAVGVVNGAKEIKLDESCLNDLQREEIELGISTIEDFMPDAPVFGRTVREYELIRNSMKAKELPDGSICSDQPEDSGYTNKEFEDLIYHPPVDESVESALPDSDLKEIEDDNDIEDLFG